LKIAFSNAESGIGQDGQIRTSTNLLTMEIEVSKKPIHSDNAPAAIGTYSQAIQSGNLVFMSGQIPLVPATMEIVDGDFTARARQVFENLKAVAEAAGGTLDQIVKVTIFLTDLNDFAAVNAVMESYFSKPYPARAAVGVASLPKGVDVEAEAVLAL
jgi:reactive intermediate/imine deaminase